MRTLLSRLENLDRRIIYAVVFLSILWPLFKPLGLPIVPSTEVKDFHAAIAAVPEGGTVYLAADYDPGSMPELQPMLEASIRQLCERKIKIIAASLWPAAPPLVDRALQDIAVGQYHYRDGIDFVNLGFKEGREVVMVQVGENLRAAYPVDTQGRSLDSLPVTQNVRGLTDLALLVNISAGYPGTREWVQQARSRFNIRMLSGCTAVSTPEYFTYYQSKQVSGLLGGLAGAAEYEKLVGRTGSATSGMDAQSLGHLAIIFFILVGNAVYLTTRDREGKDA